MHRYQIVHLLPFEVEMWDEVFSCSQLNFHSVEVSSHSSMAHIALLHEATWNIADTAMQMFRWLQLLYHGHLCAVSISGTEG